MDFKIVFYKDSFGKSPIEEFFLKLASSTRLLLCKAREGIEKLRNKAYHKEPLSKYIEQGLWELRIRSENNILRILYTFKKGQIVILLHSFIKKQQKTPERELKLARKRLKELKE